VPARLPIFKHHMAVTTLWLEIESKISYLTHSLQAIVHALLVGGVGHANPVPALPSLISICSPQICGILSISLAQKQYHEFNSDFSENSAYISASQIPDCDIISYNMQFHCHERHHKSKSGLDTNSNQNNTIPASCEVQIVPQRQV
jgi:hypothetical protein